MKILKNLFLLSLSLLFLTACSNKPEEVSQEVWDRSIQYTLYIDKLVEDGDSPEALGADLSTLTETKEEKEIVAEVVNLSVKSIVLSLAKLTNTSVDEAQKSYDEQYDKLKDIFGSDLKRAKLDVDKVKTYIAESKLIQEEKRKQERESVMKQWGVTLTGKEVQYDLSNNLDKEFYLEGNLKLCTYYNYGFTNETDFFCGQLTPFDGGYTDSWYLYFHRESFKTVYDKLLNGNVDIRVVAEIPYFTYERGQGNMAKVKRTQLIQ